MVIVVDRELETPLAKPTVDVEEIPVVEEWGHLLDQANEVAKVADRHLDYESIYQGHDLNPSGLCPQQRVNLVSDLRAAIVS